jgi:hypothetical protein
MEKNVDLKFFMGFFHQPKTWLEQAIMASTPPQFQVSVFLINDDLA